MKVEDGKGLLTCRTIAKSHTHRADWLVREQAKANGVNVIVVYQVVEKYIEVWW